MHHFLYLLLFVFLSLPTYAVEGNVTSVIDGDTFVLEDGTHVRMLGINTPEKARGGKPAQEGSKEATIATTQLIKGKIVKLVFDDNRTDRYGRTLAHTYLPDGTWVNRELVARGLAHVYSFPDNRSLLNELLEAETIARSKKLGLWKQKDWQVLEAIPTPPKSFVGKYRLVRGIPIKAVTIGDTIYLNFEDNWRTDFTIEIPTSTLPLFKSAGINPLTDYIGKEVIARGRIKPVNGILVTVNHPEQIQNISE